MSPSVSWLVLFVLEQKLLDRLGGRMGVDMLGTHLFMIHSFAVEAGLTVRTVIQCLGSLGSGCSPG